MPAGGSSGGQREAALQQAAAEAGPGTGLSSHPAAERVTSSTGDGVEQKLLDVVGRC